MTVIVIAAIGFGNYLLLKLFGRRGVEATGFLGGLVNSTVAVAELSARVKEVGASLASVAYRGRHALGRRDDASERGAARHPLAAPRWPRRWCRSP